MQCCLQGQKEERSRSKARQGKAGGAEEEEGKEKAKKLPDGVKCRQNSARAG